MVRSDNVAWDVGLSAWGNRNRVVSAGAFPFVLTGGGGVSQIVEAGLPLGSYSGTPILGYADANHDGVLSPAEVQLGTERAFLGTPLPTEGAALTTALTWRRRIRVASLLEYRAGSSELNDTELMRWVKAADALDAYLKCATEYAAGNREFAVAERQLEAKARAMDMPEVAYFLDHFAPSFRKTLDEIAE